MRADYGLYVLAIICFIIAGLVSLGTFPQYLPELATLEGTVITVVFSALGLIFAILGYALRPKPIISIPEALKPAVPPSPHALPSTEEATTVPSPAPTPTKPLPKEETAKPERKKTSRKRRKKKA